MSSNYSTPPKMALDEFEYLANMFVVPLNGKFFYYPIKVTKPESPSQPIFHFEKSPPVIVDGFVTFQRSVYEVPTQDLLRGIIRAFRKVKPKEYPLGTGQQRNESTRSGDEKTAKSTKLKVERTQHGSPFGPSELEIDQGINNAWEEEIGTLLHFYGAKEGGEWEVQSSVQPQPSHESSPVSDPQPNP